MSDDNRTIVAHALSEAVTRHGLARASLPGRCPWGSRTTTSTLIIATVAAQAASAAPHEASPIDLAAVPRAFVSRPTDIPVTIE